MHAVVRSRQLAVGAIATFLIALGACASHPSRPAKPPMPAADPAAAAEAKGLYAGVPPAVHATEFPVESAEDGLQRGDDAWRKGDLDLALYLYVQALGFDSESATPLLRIASIHEQRGNRPLARRAFELALAREPANAGASERLGLLCLEDGDGQAARSLLMRAVAIDPTRWRPQNGLGILEDQAGNYRAAIAHYDLALKLEPNAAPVLNNRGFSRFLAGDLELAEADFRAAIKAGAGGDAWVNLARLQARRKQYTEALESFLRALDLPKAYNALGKSAMENKDYPRAREYFEMASSASPTYFEEAQKNLALANQKMLADSAGKH